ncbi:venom serine protease [Halyomorpha halys]|uniref:venom serine protease n=1 Tax=Halyomorpha halys TaxID=286706 RepID=UPI0006D4D1D2
MRTVSIELFFPWILLACSHLRRASAYDMDDYFENEDKPSYSMKDGNLAMSCNCSWGTMPNEFQVDNRRRIGYKIVGGSPVNFNRGENYPMLAAIQPDQGCTFCGASILTEFHALTAAHCFEQDLPKMTLAVGIRYRCREPYDGGQYIPLLDPPYIHEYYDDEENQYDIAIVVTQWKILFGNNVGPVCIYTKPFISMEESILALGWGRVAEDGNPSRELLKVVMKPLDIEICKDMAPPGVINTNLNLQMCTYSYNKDTCAGDSGGPLFIMDHSVDRLIQVAIVSMGVGCGRSDEPGINTFIFPYLGWIQWTIERSLRKMHPKEFHQCGNSFCYFTKPLRNN